MAEVKPFRGIRYDERKVGELSRVVSPPYDVIDSTLQDELYAASPYGIVRVDYGKIDEEDDASANRYTRGAALYRSWLSSGVLVEDPVPSIYYVEEDYKGEFGVMYTRTGFLAGVRVKDAESGVYRPHEKTLAGPKADRLELTRACKANLSPVFSLYDDPEGLIDSKLAEWKKAATSPDARVKRPDGFEIRMWRVSDETVLETIQRVMEPLSFYIADGHHRYETALNYRNEKRREFPDYTGREPWNYTLMYLVNMHSPGLRVLPTHRAVFGLENFAPETFLKSLEGALDVREVKGGTEALLAEMKAARGKYQALGVVLKGDSRLFIASPKEGFKPDEVFASKTPALRVLDVTLLHSLVIERILKIDEKAQEAQKNLVYVKEAKELVRMVSEGEADVGFLLNPTPVANVKEAAEAGERMPQKSTFFYPKIVTGLVINPLGE